MWPGTRAGTQPRAEHAERQRMGAQRAPPGLLTLMTWPNWRTGGGRIASPSRTRFTAWCGPRLTRCPPSAPGRHAPAVPGCTAPAHQPRPWPPAAAQTTHLAAPVYTGAMWVSQSSGHIIIEAASHACTAVAHQCEGQFHARPRPVGGAHICHSASSSVAGPSCTGVSSKRCCSAAARRSSPRWPASH